MATDSLSVHPRGCGERILGALAKQADNLITATALGANVEPAWLDEQTPDVLIDLASQVIEVNPHFFAQRVLPALTAATDRLLAVTGGTNGLAGSLPQDSTTAA